MIRHIHQRERHVCVSACECTWAMYRERLRERRSRGERLATPPRLNTAPRSRATRTDSDVSRPAAR
eukprot:5550726-Prymnesium_polylepis.1